VTWKSSIPNLLGRGESVRLHLSRRWSVNGTDGCLQLATSRINTRTGRVSYLAEAGRRRENVLWRGLFLKEYYTSLTATFDPFPWLQQELSAAVSARDLEIANGNWTHNPDLVPFSAREQCGYSMKSSLSQTVKVDTRDDSVLPSKGTLLKWFSELSGPIGDAAFFKNELLGSIYLPFTSSATLSLSCSAAMLTPLGPAASAFSSAAADATRFKNPLQCRGWNNSACSAGDFSFGQHSRLLAVASSVKLSFPVPFLRGAKTWILRNTRTHVFCDYGATGGVAYPGFRLWDTVSRIDEWAQFSSLTAGIGVALRLGDFGRAELNYCHPLHGNASLRGLQLGIGVNIL
jgi:outer membrane protein assembly factor BamA